MQAQDIINALLFIKQNPPFKIDGNIDEIPVVLVGSSHGGYLSHLVAKIAPWLIDGIIDNCGYAIIYWPFIGFGKEIDYTKYFSGFADTYFNHISLYFSDKTFWTLDKSSPSYFSKSREYIRNILNLDHLKIQSEYKKQIYTSYHYAYDTYYAPVADKIKLYEELKKFGFDTTLNVIQDESQVDGKFIKALEHGLDMSIKTLIKKELPKTLKKISSRKKQNCYNKSISYISDNLEYNFFEADNKINLVITKPNLIINKTYNTISCNDVELGVARNSSLEFYLYYNKEKPITSIVCIISGLGGDMNSGYKEHLAQFVASQFNAAVISPNYHCIGNRPQTGATFMLDKLDLVYLQEQCLKIGINFKGQLKESDDALKISELLFKLDEFIEDKKSNQLLPQDHILRPSLTLKPTKDEYQNFGIMQAQDIINAILFTKKLPIFSKDNTNLPVIVIGSSHGGYLAHLSAKIAPWLINGVIDNSGYAGLPFRLIGFGKEIDYTKYPSCASKGNFKNIYAYMSDKTLWTLNKSSPNYFSQAHEEIRHVLNIEHLKIQSQFSKPIYVSYHCAIDDIAPADEKMKLYDEFKKLGFDATLNMIDNENQVDGKFIKSLKHGLDISIKTLITKELPPMLYKISKQKIEICKDKNISYISDNLEYNFYEENEKINLKITKLD